ncbi:MAG: hypothetical protein Q9220_003357 [cf. Caloplaca sp. 1 TL-2023]
MLLLNSIALFAAFAAAVPSPRTTKRQSSDKQVVFRTDLKSGMGQSPQFKDLLPSGFDITFVSISEVADAARGVVASKGIPIGVSDGSTRWFNIGTTSDPQGQQPITLGQRGQSQGFLYEQGGELKLGSTNPQWDTWVICNNATLKHPELSWVGVVQGVVALPPWSECSAVRLFAEDPANPTQNLGTC